MDNQILEELDYLLPDDYEEPEEETTEAEEPEETDEPTETDEAEEVEAEEPEPEETTEGEEEQEAVSLNDVEIKFLKETKKLSEYKPDEVKSLVQRGLNYDREVEKYNEVNGKYAEAQKQVDEIAEIAKLHNLDVDQLKEGLLNEYFKTQKNPELAKRNYEIEKEQRVTSSEQAKEKELKSFVEKYPGIKSEDINQETWAKNKEGMPLAEAYAQQLQAEKTNKLQAEIDDLRKQLKIKETNAKSEKKSPVKPTTGKGDGKNKEDDFLVGLLG